jgi:hypothetical protein
MGDPHLTENMSDEELLAIWRRVKDGDGLTLIEQAVIKEIERRNLGV